MSLRNKILWIMGGALGGLFLLLFIVSSNILLTSFTSLEQQAVERNVNRLLNILSSEIKGLQTEVKDYASWDDTYAYLHTHDSAFIKSNLDETTFDTLRLNLLAILDLKGEVVFGQTHDAIEHRLQPIPNDFVRQHFGSNSMFTYNEASQGKIAGFLLFEQQVILMACQPILTSQSFGPSRGTLIMGRLLSEPEIEKLSTLTQLNITIQPLYNHQLPESFRNIHAALTKQSIVIRAWNQNYIAGYSLIRDIYQHPIALLSIEMPREIYSKGLTSLSYLSALVLVFAVSFAIFILWLFETLILKRLARLNNEVMQIYTLGELATVTVEGKDELSRLATAINDMLKRILKSESSLAEAQRITHLGNWDWDIAENNFHCSDEIYRIFGITPQSIMPSYELFLNYVHPEDRHLVAGAINKAMSEHRVYSVEHRIIQQDGTIRYIHTQGEMLCDQQGQITHIIGTLQDITERKLTEEQTLQLLEENRFLSQNLIKIQELERRELARELHDEFGQSITAIQADAETIIELAHESEITAERLAKIPLSAQAILDVSAHIYDLVHSLMQQLRPTGLDELGLVETLQELTTSWQARYQEMRCTLTIKGNLQDLGETINITIYRIVQECLTNVAKYAQATEVIINLINNSATQLIQLTIQDNGCGMDINMRKRGLGLIGMRERAQALKGGQLQIESTGGVGTKITFTVPTNNHKDLGFE
jgi:hypothetical protein